MEILEKLLKPSITDWIQAIGSVAAMIGVAFTLWKLLKRDLDREKEVNSLIKISESIENLLIDSENRTKIMVKPSIEIRMDKKERNPLIFRFINNKNTSTIKEFLIDSNYPEEINIEQETIIQDGFTQQFTINVFFNDKKNIEFNLKAKYTTVEGFKYIQNIIVILYNGMISFNTSPIIFKN